MKYTTITKDNIHLIAFRIKQFIERMGCVSMTNYYPWAALRKEVFGDIKDNITQSNECLMLASEYKMEIDRNCIGRRKDDPFIRFNFHYGASAFLLEVGDKVCIKTNHIYAKTKRILDNDKNREIWKKGNPEKAQEQAETNKYYDDQYWADYENEISQLDWSEI